MASNALNSVLRVVIWLTCGGAAVVVGPLFSLIGLFALWTDYTFSREQVEATAAIIAKSTQVTSPSKGSLVTYYYLTCKWTLPENGREQTSRVRVTPNFWSNKDVGQSIKIVYRQSNPNDARLPGESSWPLSILSVGFGAVIFATGRALLAWNRSRRARAVSS